MLATSASTTARATCVTSSGPAAQSTSIAARFTAYATFGSAIRPPTAVATYAATILSAACFTTARPTRLQPDNWRAYSIH